MVVLNAERWRASIVEEDIVWWLRMNVVSMIRWEGIRLPPYLNHGATARATVEVGIATTPFDCQHGQVAGIHELGEIVSMKGLIQDMQSPFLT